jgi:Fe-S cluster assembly iron-binding protein IscA
MKKGICKRSGKEARMFEVTQKADEMIQEFFKGKEDARNIRIFLSQGG